MSEETDPPRCVWSSARPSIGGILAPADNGPAPTAEPCAEEHEPRGEQHIERDPDADDAPTTFEREHGERDEDRARREHRPHQILRVARTDEDSVEREDRTADRLHDREIRPQPARLVQDARI